MWNPHEGSSPFSGVDRGGLGEVWAREKWGSDGEMWSVFSNDLKSKVKKKAGNSLHEWFPVES